ncbi:TPA: hypothetical protein EYH33_07415 [Candidatus Bipolaricaulota bacterium]|nr:hypothetical protein [Candidatus Bipolaricaulota bacterium]
MKRGVLLVALLSLLGSVGVGLPPGEVQEVRVGQLVNIGVSPGHDHIAILFPQGIRVFSPDLEPLVSLPLDQNERPWAVAVAGDYLACGTAGGLVRLWGLSTGQPLREWREIPGMVWCLGFSPDGTRLAAGGLDGTLIVWDTASGEEVYRADFAGGVWGLNFSPQGALLAVGLSQGVGLVDLESGSEVLALAGVSGEVWGLAFSPGGERLAVGTAAGEVGVWGQPGWTPLWIQAGHEEPVWAVAFDHSGDYLLTAGTGRMVKIWRATDGLELGALALHAAAVRLVAPLARPGACLSASEDGKLARWELPRVLSLRPQVRDVFYTERIRAGREQVIMVSFRDVNRDLSWAYLELVEGDKARVVVKPGWSFRPHLSGHGATSFSFSLKVEAPQRVRLRLVLVDGAGLRSDPYEFSVEAY